MKIVRYLACSLIICVMCAPAMHRPDEKSGAVASLHDFWLAPSSFRPAVGSSVDLSLLVGHPDRHTPYVRNPRHIRRFVAAFGDSLHIVRGVPGRDPAGSVVFEGPGLAVIGYSSRPTITTLHAARFEAYLEEEGLEHVRVLRDQRGESRKPGRERFSRSAKSLLQVGGIGRAGYDRRLGFPFELVPGRNPYEMAVGDALPVQLRYRGTPLSGALVAAVHTESGRTASSQRSDVNGFASLPLDRPGVWMIKSVHMVPVEDDREVDWESIWATLTFELPSGPGGTPR